MSAKTLYTSTAGMLWTDRRDFYLSPNQTKELWTDAAPFTTIVSNRAMESVPDPDFKLFEHRAGWIDQHFHINAGSPDAWATNGDPASTLASDNAVAIDGVSGVVADDSLVGMEIEIYASDNSTYKGVALITAYSSGVKLKALGNPRAVNLRMSALADDDICYVIGSAFGEGSVSPEAFSDDIEVVYNSSQIFRTPVEVTGTLYHQTKLRGYSNELARLREQKNFEHKMQKEKALLFGVRIGGTGSTDLGGDNVTNADSFAGEQAAAKTRTTMGLIPCIYRYGTTTGDNKNIFTITKSTYAYDDFVDDMEKVFRFNPMGGTEKIALCGPTMLSYWSKQSSNTNSLAANTGWTITMEAVTRNELGFNIRRLITPHGNLLLVPAPALKGVYASSMLVIDDKNLGLKQYRPMKYSTNIKTENGYDGVKDEFFSDEGLAVQLIETHSIFNLA